VKLEVCFRQYVRQLSLFLLLSRRIIPSCLLSLFHFLSSPLSLSLSLSLLSVCMCPCVCLCFWLKLLAILLLILKQHNTGYTSLPPHTRAKKSCLCFSPPKLTPTSRTSVFLLLPLILKANPSALFFCLRFFTYTRRRTHSIPSVFPSLPSLLPSPSTSSSYQHPPSLPPSLVS